MKKLLLISCALLMLSSCGQEGPLYLPPHSADVTPPSHSSSGAAATAAAAIA